MRSSLLSRTLLSRVLVQIYISFAYKHHVLALTLSNIGLQWKHFRLAVFYSSNLHQNLL